MRKNILYIKENEENLNKKKICKLSTIWPFPVKQFFVCSCEKVCMINEPKELKFDRFVRVEQQQGGGVGGGMENEI